MSSGSHVCLSPLLYSDLMNANHIQNIMWSNRGETKKDFSLLVPTTPFRLLLHKNKLIYIMILGPQVLLQKLWNEDLGAWESVVWYEGRGKWCPNLVLNIRSLDFLWDPWMGFKGPIKNLKILCKIVCVFLHIHMHFFFYESQIVLFRM